MTGAGRRAQIGLSELDLFDQQVGGLVHRRLQVRVTLTLSLLMVTAAGATQALLPIEGTGPGRCGVYLIVRARSLLIVIVVAVAAGCGPVTGTVVEGSSRAPSVAVGRPHRGSSSSRSVRWSVRSDGRTLVATGLDDCGHRPRLFATPARGRIVVRLATPPVPPATA